MAFPGYAVATAFAFLLLAIEPTGAFTLRSSFGSASRRGVASFLDLGTRESSEQSTTSSSAKNHDWHPLNRREALFKGFIAGGSGIASALSLPSPSGADTASANVQDVILRPLASPSSSSAVTSLLSNYNPTDYKTLPSYGRSVFPPPFLPPLENRATYRYSLGRNAWALEQLIAFANVTATIRTNVIQLEDGGLWVCGPLWPTDEYCALLDELGPVTNVVLPTNALEHKAAMKQFLRKYPRAEVWISPGQYGPFGECGVVTDDMDEDQVNMVVKKAGKTMGYRVDGILPLREQTGSQSNALQKPKPKNMFPSWAGVFDTEVLCVNLPGNAGPVSECAFVHKPSKTLVVTDAVVCVPAADDAGVNDSALKFPIQPIFSSYFDQTILSDPTFWPRTVLQAVFLPLRTEPDKTGTAVYPGYEALTNRLVRAPILRAFADARAPDSVRNWVTRVSGLATFDRIITAHFASPINAGPDLFTQAFAHLNPGLNADELSSSLPPIECQDWSTLNSLNDFIDDNNLGAPVVYDFRRGCKAE
mmetsp:Transcript_8298/g.15538  ORF Transcript_8298/g.15538 Transcript_8298/m.15538 type:complete len:534 (-) Transcript_8298:35-1636(-)